MARGESKAALDNDLAREEATDLITELQAAQTSGDLWKVAQTPEFKAATEKLSDAALQVLRDTFKAFDVMLKGKVKPDDVQGEILRVMSWDYNTSPQFPDSEFIVLKGVREEHNGEKFEMVSGAKRVLRFFKDIDPRDVPQRVMLIRETADEMVSRQAKAGTSPMWIVKRMSTSSTGTRATAGAPF